MLLTCFNGVEEVLPLSWVPNVRVNQKTVHLRVDVFNGNLEAIETSRFSHLHLGTESLNLARENGQYF